MIRLFKTNWSKWKPMCFYNNSTDNRLVMARINRKTGLIQFRTITVATTRLPYETVNFREAFKELNTTEVNN